MGGEWNAMVTQMWTRIYMFLLTLYIIIFILYIYPVIMYVRKKTKLQ